MLLHYAGEDVYDIYDTYRDDADSYTNVKEKLSTHFKPTKHTKFRVFEFRQTHQLQNETVDICDIWCVYRSGGLIDGYSALGVVYNVSLEVVMTMHAG